MVIFIIFADLCLSPELGGGLVDFPSGIFSFQSFVSFLLNTNYSKNSIHKK